jgi:hypothetical protein
VVEHYLTWILTILRSSISLYLRGICPKFPDKHRYLPSSQWIKTVLVHRMKWLHTLKFSCYLYIFSPFRSNLLIVILHNISIYIEDGPLECTASSHQLKGSVATSSSTFLSFSRTQAFFLCFLRLLLVWSEIWKRINALSATLIRSCRPRHPTC